MKRCLALVLSVGVAAAMTVAAAAQSANVGSSDGAAATPNRAKKQDLEKRSRPATAAGRLRSRAPASLDQMIGQMIMVGFRGTTARDAGVRAVARQLRDGMIGGVMLLAHNITGSSQLKALTRSLKQSTAGRRPPLIAVDQEGGWVQRLKGRNGFASTRSARNVAANYSADKARSVVYAKMAGQLAENGINLNFGPVVDLDVTGTRNPIIGRIRRSYGRDPEVVLSYAQGFIDAHRAHQVVTAAKHFPGHGSSLTDSHKGFTDISRTWSKSELIPYRRLAREKGVAMVMVGHLYHPSFSDGPGQPATLSSKAISHWLRRELGFKGVVITDDMEMGAIRKNFKFRDAVVRAVTAGNDILLYANTAKSDRNLALRIHEVIKTAVADGVIPPRRIEDSYRRITSMKDEWLRARQGSVEN
ncbi:MAG: glycoside hydrolase family 3 protein [Methyloligellaceae bacterium]